jgi:hypothetical protein
MSEIKVNKISPRSGTTVTLGDSGDTFTIPSGATINNQGTATNFGATGSASWTTTVKTSGFTAVAGEGYFVNTTGGAVSVNLPAGTAGAVVAFKDYLGTFDTNALTLVQNGSDKIGGSTNNSVISVEGIALTLVFIDSTQGWLVTDSGLQSEAPGPEFITATGGTITTVCTNFKVHTFTGPGTFAVSCAGNAAGSNTVSYMVVGGGGSGGKTAAGGGGAGGFREGKTTTCSYTASPLNAPAGLPVSVQSYPITVGAGGAGTATNPSPGNPGNPSTFSSITSTGGGSGGGGTGPGSGTAAGSGGSGGGAQGGTSPANPTGGAGNTPPVSPSQGFPGGPAPSPSGSPAFAGGGGGGATTVGENGGASSPYGDGGAGATTSINGSPTIFAGGGGGSSDLNSPGNNLGGPGGGGNGGIACGVRAAVAGTANTGGGSGALGYSCGSAVAGGSGIVIIRYKFQ